MEINTRIAYLYRDACNYKSHNEVVVAGKISDEQMEIVLDSLDEGLYFIPSQIGLPEIRFEEETEDDHPWFELERYGFCLTTDAPTVDITIEQLVEAFANAAEEGWKSL